MIEVAQENRYFTVEDSGCYADGTFGHQYLRGRLADLIDNLATGATEYPQELYDSLRGPMPDDAGDEYEALEILQQNTSDDASWEIEDGLYLIPLSE
jgi:hypothetical protein